MLSLITYQAQNRACIQRPRKPITEKEAINCIYVELNSSVVFTESVIEHSQNIIYKFLSL